MFTLAAIVLHPGGLIAWLILGLIAGWLAGVAMKGSGYGLIGDLFFGLIGALIGGFLFGLLVEGDYGFWGSMVVASLGPVSSSPSSVPLLQEDGSDLARQVIQGPAQRLAWAVATRPLSSESRRQPWRCALCEALPCEGK